MTLRETISSLLADAGEGSDPSAALAEAGFGDVAPEAFGTALVHFSDTSSLPEADALAPIATRMSTVPFEETDLASTDAEPSDDAFALFQAVDPDPTAFLTADGGDLPADFDSAGEDIDPALALNDVPEDAVESTDGALDGGFGGGEDSLDDLVETTTDPVTAVIDDVIEETGAPVIDDEPFDDGFDAAFGEDADSAVDEAADLFSVDFSDGDDPEADPLDLDFD